MSIVNHSDEQRRLKNKVSAQFFLTFFCSVHEVQPPKKTFNRKSALNCQCTARARRVFSYCVHCVPNYSGKTFLTSFSAKRLSLKVIFCKLQSIGMNWASINPIPLSKWRVNAKYMKKCQYSFARACGAVQYECGARKNCQT